MTHPLSDVVAGLGTPRILVVGDLVLDRYQRGPVERISPEAPIPVLRVEDTSSGLGGAASVAQIGAVLKADVTLIGVVGDDEPGRELAALAAEAGIRFAPHVDADRPTSVKTRFLAHGHSTHQQVLRVDRESTSEAEGAVIAGLQDAAERALPEVDAVLLSDYGKGCLTPALLRVIIDAARARGIPVLVDPKGRDFSKYRGATALTPNRPETQGATGRPVRSVAEAGEAAASLCRDLELDFALVTLDREGMYLAPRSGDGVHLATTPRDVFDVTGAGDMVLAVLATALASGAAPVDAARLANLAAGVAVERVGVATVTRSELAARAAGAGVGVGSKVVAFDGAGDLKSRLRETGRTVVFTNGCFDILHAGHVAFLAAAKSEGDVLVVGLNSDASVSRLKGPARPVNGVADRAAVLAGLAAVDHVIVFEGDTPAELIEALTPDVLVKGKDWEDKGVVGREHVEASGGRVVLVELLDGRSTTGVIEQIRDES